MMQEMRRTILAHKGCESFLWGQLAETRSEFHVVATFCSGAAQAQAVRLGKVVQLEAAMTKISSTVLEFLAVLPDDGCGRGRRRGLRRYAVPGALAVVGTVGLGILALAWVLDVDLEDLYVTT